METENNYTGLAVITGASSGIGFELAKKFAENGYDLIIVAEDAGIVEAAKTFEKLGVHVTRARIDLSSEQGVEDFYSIVKSARRPVDAICVNNGVGSESVSFDKTDLQKEMNLIRLNVLSVVHLTKLILKDMLIFGQGKILFTTSFPFRPGVHESLYLASKAFVQSFAETLHEENKDKGIVITILQPGVDETHFADVAEEGFSVLMKRDENHIAGFKNHIRPYLSKFKPHLVAATMNKDTTLPELTADI